jgi:hypothetical protein
MKVFIHLYIADFGYAKLSIINMEPFFCLSDQSD